MAQIKNNQVKFGVNVKPTFANPSFRTQTTTPMSQVGPAQGMTFPSMGALGITPKLSKSPTPLVPGTNNYTPTSIQALGGNRQPSISTSTPQTGQTAAPAINSAQNSIPSGSQGALSTTQTTGVNSRGGIDRPSTRPEGFFPGVLNDLLGASKATREQESARKEMERISAGNKAIGDNAAAISKQYGDEIARIGGIGAGQLGQLGRGTTNVAYGNAMTAQNMASARMDALAKGQQAALEGTAQQLTGQEQQAQAFKPSLEASLTQQAQQLSGLGTAAGLAAPINLPYSAGGFDPVTGQQIAGGLGGYSGYKAAEQTFDLSGQYPDAGFQYNPNLTPQQNLQMMQAAQQGSPTYQRGTYGQAGAMNPQQAANISLGQQGYNQFGLQTEQLRQSVATAESLGQNLASVMEQFSINGQPLKAINIPFNTLKKQYAPEMTAFQTALRETANAYNQVFATTGTTPTDAQAISEAIFDERSTPQQMIAALEQLGQQAKKKVEIAEQSTSGFYGLLPNQGGGAGGGGVFDF